MKIFPEKTLAIGFVVIVFKLMLGGIVNEIKVEEIAAGVK